MQKYRYNTVRNGLVGHWRPSRGPTGNTLIDSMRGNHGTLTNGATWLASGTNYALSFDGSNDYVTIPSNSSLQLIDQTTIAFWINVTNNAAFNAFVTKGTPSEFEIGADFRSSLTSLTWRPGSVSNIDNFFNGFTSTWVHVTVTLTGSASYTVSSFRNGIFFSGLTGGTVNTRTSSSSALIIGGRAGSFPSNSRIDDICIFNRILAPSEILTLYTAGRGGLDQIINVPIVRGSAVDSGISGSANQTELDDISSQTGSLSLNATVSQTELADTVTQTGSTTISGSTSQTELDDTVSQTASLTITGTANYTELDDISSESGTILISAVVDQLELDDLVNQSGTVGNTNYASANQLELDDTSTSTGSLSLNLSGSQLELPDTQTATSSITVRGSVSQTELSDISVATANVTIRGSASQTELNDITLATGTQEEQSPIPRLTITSFTESTQANLSITRTSAVLVITNTKQT